METITEPALDWTADPEFVDARQRLRDVEGILEQRERERQLLWDCKFSNDRFEQARHRAEWPDAEKAAATADAYVHQAKTRLALAEQAAKQRAQPAWDARFRESWAAIETVLTGPLMEAITEWERLTAEAGAKNMIVPALLPANLTSETIPPWLNWVRSQLGIVEHNK